MIRKHTLVLLEIALCWGPTVLWLGFGLLVLPHHVWLLVRFGAVEAIPSIVYDVGATAGAVITWAAYRTVFASAKPLPVWVAVAGAILAVAALLVVPMGTLITRFVQPLNAEVATLLLLLSIFPLLCLAHVTYLSYRAAQVRARGS